MIRIDTSAVNFPENMPLSEIQRLAIIKVFQQKRYNRSHTATALGITPQFLQKFLTHHCMLDWRLENE